jgi:hypothetical protein
MREFWESNGRRMLMPADFMLGNLRYYSQLSSFYIWSSHGLHSFRGQSLWEIWS